MQNRHTEGLWSAGNNCHFVVSLRYCLNLSVSSHDWPKSPLSKETFNNLNVSSAQRPGQEVRFDSFLLFPVIASFFSGTTFSVFSLQA